MKDKKYFELRQLTENICIFREKILNCSSIHKDILAIYDKLFQLRDSLEKEIIKPEYLDVDKNKNESDDANMRIG